MSDQLQRFLYEHAPVRGEVVQLDATWRAVLARHDYPLSVQQLLGESMAAAALLAATVKFDGSLIMQMHGSGPVRLLVVECTSDHGMRATAKWDGDPEPGTLARMLGAGRFVISIVPSDGRQSYQGIVELRGEHVADALEHYLRSSEQIDSRLWLAADAKRAGGLLLQRLPDAPDADADAWNRALQLGATVKRDELLHVPAPTLIRRLYHEEDLRVFEPRPVEFRCSCTRARVSAMLQMLGHAEVESILAERGSVEVRCEFCNREYLFDPVDAAQAVADAGTDPAPQTRH